MKATLLLSLILLVSSCRQTAKDTRSGAPVVESSSIPGSDTASPMSGTLSAQEMSEGWRPLFDGRSTSGWHVYLAKSDGSAWKVDSGYLFLDPSKKVDGKVVGGGDLVSDSTYGDFHLSLEWRVSPKGNSGIFFGIQEDPKYEFCWFTGPEMQILDNDGHPDGKISKHRAGNLYDLYASGIETVKPVGEWNHAEVRLEKGFLECRLNGYVAVSVTMGDGDWRQRVRESKFRDMPGFAAFMTGRIGLQDHGDPVWFRNIKIRRLS